MTRRGKRHKVGIEKRFADGDLEICARNAGAQLLKHARRIITEWKKAVLVPAFGVVSEKLGVLGMNADWDVMIAFVLVMSLNFDRCRGMIKVPVRAENGLGDEIQRLKTGAELLGLVSGINHDAFFLAGRHDVRVCVERTHNYSFNHIVV